MSITLAFVALGCGTNSRGNGALVSVVLFKTYSSCHPVKGFGY